jgi:poly(3-hydroxybutyrate) depolymerase
VRFHVNFIFILLFSIAAFMPEKSIAIESEITLTDAHLINLQRGYRFSLAPNDPIEKLLISGRLEHPEEGQMIKMNDTTEAVWEPLQADEEGWFKGRSLRRAYVWFSYKSPKEDIVLLEGMGHSIAFVNGEPRAGNQYQYKEEYESWEPRFDFSLLPIKLKKGRNDLLFQCSRGLLKVKLHPTSSAAIVNAKDATLPDLFVGEPIDSPGAVVLINASTKKLEGCSLSGQAGNISVKAELPRLLPLSTRKVRFDISGSAPDEKGDLPLTLNVTKAGKTIASADIVLRVLTRDENQKHTFISRMDGSVQYYSIQPSLTKDANEQQALFLSLHGASVEALNQTGSYSAKSWGHVVAPTNRRPYGFNWEDWGRTDALEVLDIVQDKLNIDPDRVYLTGHSMGGHGTWHVGATFPDKFAAIGPSAGWISFWSYLPGGEAQQVSKMDSMLIRAAQASNTFGLVENYKNLGVYILHGTDDRVVKAEQAHSMIEHLEKFHKDWDYHEEPGAGHWWDNSDESGADCVDWAPLFDFYARHARTQTNMKRQVDFITANPGISSTCYWLGVYSQENPLQLSSTSIRFDPGKKRFVGSTDNVKTLMFDLNELAIEDSVSFDLDSVKIAGVDVPADMKIWLSHKDDSWTVAQKPSTDQKGSHRYGTFKDAINNNVLFVYGSKGSKAQKAWALNKARYDAERFWYQGNGSIEIISDKEFDATATKDRNVILYGNADTNTAWKTLLADCPVLVKNGNVQIGDRTLQGKDKACLFIYPRPDSDSASVGVVSGSGLLGMKLTNKRSYLAAGFAFPDLMVFSPQLLNGDSDGINVAGFFGLDWSLENGDFVWNE